MSKAARKKTAQADPTPAPVRTYAVGELEVRLGVEHWQHVLVCHRRGWLAAQQITQDTYRAALEVELAAPVNK